MVKPTIEEHTESQSLKATFVTRRMMELDSFDLFTRVENFLANLKGSLDWKRLEEFGVNQDIYESISAQGLEPDLYFCHPNILIAKPEFLTYFRCMAVYSQKALKAISGVSSVDKIEKGQSCSSEQAQALSQAINVSLCLVYRTLSEVNRENTSAMMFSTLGVSIDGSWRNKIGQEGERVIRSIILSELKRRDELKLVSLKNGDDVSQNSITYEWIEKFASDIKSAICMNGSVLEFSSEPDVRCISPNGRTTAGVEVKAGLDPAGALERLGAMQKSFAKIHKEEPDAETVLIASCITDEVQRRLNENTSVTRVLSLTDIISNKRSAATEFANFIRAYLGLVQKRF